MLIIIAMPTSYVLFGWYYHLISLNTVFQLCLFRFVNVWNAGQHTHRQHFHAIRSLILSLTCTEQEFVSKGRECKNIDRFIRAVERINCVFGAHYNSNNNNCHFHKQNVQLGGNTKSTLSHFCLCWKLDKEYNMCLLYVNFIKHFHRINFGFNPETMSEKPITTATTANSNNTQIGYSFNANDASISINWPMYVIDSPGLNCFGSEHN